MKTLLAFNLHSYGRPERGLSYEFFNLYQPLETICDEVVQFDFAGLESKLGRAGMNRRLLEVLEQERPDVSIFALVGEEFDPDTIQRAKEYTRTVAYFFDDIWRRDYVAFWASRFDHFTTPIWSCYRDYVARGLVGAIYSPFGFNSRIYRKIEGPYRHDVSFVGGAHPWRSFVVDRLRRAGYEVAAFGPYWPAGMLGQDEMVELFCRSRINLNLSNARNWDARYLLSSWRALRTVLKSPKVRDGIKGRHFEIAGCGGFQLSYYAEDLERHFRIGDEIGVYLDPDDLVEKVAYYLANDAERERIARGGLERARREHTADQRLLKLLQDVVKQTKE